MESIQEKNRWDSMKELLKEKFATLTDKDFSFAEGQSAEMFEFIQVKLNKTPGELAHVIEGLDSDCS